ncbi:cobalamin-binding protein [candidate division KSB1 bacterium]|nr:MAG: cobalamin-binding protein [candidate division KSB1 bacterium]RLF72596.1 MAG: cobalamin-binding protein [Thermoplasmata archaeon]
MTQTAKKQIGMWVLVALLIVAAFGGGYILAGVSTEEGTTTTTGAITIIDGIGRTVTIPHTPQRIVSLASSATETIYALGAGDKVVGRDKYSKYPDEVKEVPEVGSGSSPNLEMIIGLKPDVLFAWPYSRDALINLEDEISVVYIDPGSVNEVIDTIRMIGLIIGKTSEAENLTAEMQSRIDAITDITDNLNKTQRPLVYYELGTPMKTVGPGTFTNELIFMAGGINLAADEPVRYPILNSEYIIERNPDVIVIVSYGASIDEVKNREGWQNINAVKNDRIYKIDTNLVTSNPRLVQGLEQFAKWFHPDLFD